jgi:hypothetical protein
MFLSWYELGRKSLDCDTGTGGCLWYFVRERVSTQIRIWPKMHVTLPVNSVLFKHNIYRYGSGSCMDLQDTNHFFFVSMLHVRLTNKWLWIDKFRLLKFLAYLSDWLISNKISLLSKICGISGFRTRLEITPKCSKLVLIMPYFEKIILVVISFVSEQKMYVATLGQTGNFVTNDFPLH